MIKRTSKENYYLDIADAVSQRSTCMRRKYGAIIVRNDEILSTGYNGAPSGVMSCMEKGECLRRKLGIASGTALTLSESTQKEFVDNAEEWKKHLIMFVEKFQKELK